MMKGRSFSGLEVRVGNIFSVVRCSEFSSLVIVAEVKREKA